MSCTTSGGVHEHDRRRSDQAAEMVSVRIGDMKLEVVVIPVSDADRAKRFYANVGWRLDADAGEDVRVIQFTPPGSGCSIMFGKNLTAAAPGSAQNLHVIVSDIAAARHALVERGVAVTQVFHCSTGCSCRFGDDDRAGTGDRVSGPAPDRRSYGSFASFSDPDGNTWLLQEVTTRLPGRMDAGATSFASTGDLADALRRASAAHAEHEARTGTADANWPDWYADYMVGEQAGAAVPS